MQQRVRNIEGSSRFLAAPHLLAPGEAVELIARAAFVLAICGAAELNPRTESEATHRISRNRGALPSQLGSAIRSDAANSRVGGHHAALDQRFHAAALLPQRVVDACDLARRNSIPFGLRCGLRERLLRRAKRPIQIAWTLRQR